MKDLLVVAQVAAAGVDLVGRRPAAGLVDIAVAAAHIVAAEDTAAVEPAAVAAAEPAAVLAAVHRLHIRNKLAAAAEAVVVRRRLLHIAGSAADIAAAKRHPAVHTALAAVEVVSSRPLVEPDNLVAPDIAAGLEPADHKTHPAQTQLTATSPKELP